MLKRILKELEAEGAIERGAPSAAYRKPGELAGSDGARNHRPGRRRRIAGAAAALGQRRAAAAIIVIPGREDERRPSPGRRRARAGAAGRSTATATKRAIIRRLGASVHKVLGVLPRYASAAAAVVPIDRKSTHRICAATSRDRGGAKNNELVLGEPLSGRIAGFPRARVVERLGSMDAPKTISLIAIHAHGIPTEFPQAVLDEAERRRSRRIRAGRTDLRAIPLVTIDPRDARDHDDAVWAGPDDDAANPGGHVVLVAIADVAHYVTPGSALDKEALKRGNSAYFPDRVVPMLPEELSADLCSLKEGVDRPCLAVRMVFDRTATSSSHNSCAA